MLRLYDFAASANCYKVRLLAAQLGLELERVPVDLFAGESQTPEHMARNPAGRTPCSSSSPGAPRRVGRDPPLSGRGNAAPSGRQARPGARRAVALLRAEPARAEHRHRPLLDPDRSRRRARGARRALAEGRQAFARRPRAAPRRERLPPRSRLLRRRHRPLRLHPRRRRRRHRARGLSGGRGLVAASRGAAGLHERPRAVPRDRRCGRSFRPRLAALRRPDPPECFARRRTRPTEACAVWFS